MIRWLLTLSATMALSLSVAPPASAEPITLNYDVVVTSKQDGVTGTNEVLDLIFSLSITFDDAVTDTILGSSPHTVSVQQYFGTPTFSALPSALSGPGPVLGDPLYVSYAETFEGRSRSSSGEISSGDIDYLIDTATYGSGPSGYGSTSLSLQRTNSASFPTVADVGVPTIDSFLAGMMMPQQFYFSSQLVDSERSVLLPGSTSYEGTATFVSSGPTGVPEPASLSLLILGIAAIAGRRHFSDV